MPIIDLAWHVDQATKPLKTDIEKLKECLGWALEYIDAIPAEAAAKLPAMPGFDRDYVDSVLSGSTDQLTE